MCTLSVPFSRSRSSVLLANRSDRAGSSRRAAFSAAWRLEPARSERLANKTELRLREKGTDKVHIYDGWAWQEEAPDDKPDWMPDEITEANVSKQGIEHLDE